MNEEEIATIEQEEIKEIAENFEFNNIDALEIKLAKKIVEKPLMENISVEVESNRLVN